MKNFRCYQLAKCFYREAQKGRYPRHVSSQLKRASLSVVCNLMEGHGRQSYLDRRRFFYIAYGSIKECIGILDATGLGNESLLALADHLSASIYKLCHAKRSP